MKPETDQPTTGQDIFSNRRYRTVLTAAVMLFLAMLTMAILVGILVNSREEDREAEFDSTLTAVYAELPMLATMLAQTPSDFAAYSVMLAPGSPVYTAAEPCDQHILTGLIRDSDGTPTDALDVVIWGDFMPHQVLRTGDAAGLEPGQWSVTLDGTQDRHVYVQIAAHDRYLSAPVVLMLRANACEENAVQVEFMPIAPLE